VVVVDRLSLFGGGRCRQVVVIRRWSLTHVGLTVFQCLLGPKVRLTIITFAHDHLDGCRSCFLLVNALVCNRRNESA
jgi:hypothetical protein